MDEVVTHSAPDDPDMAFAMLFWQAAFAVIETSARFAGWAIEQHFPAMTHSHHADAQLAVPASLEMSDETLFA